MKKLFLSIGRILLAGLAIWLLPGLQGAQDGGRAAVLAEDDGWSAPVNLSNTAGSSYAPRLALDGRGTLHLVWQDWIDTAPHWAYILYANKPAGGAWSAADYLPAHNQGNTPALAVGADDVLHIVWSNAQSNISTIYRRPDGLWSAVTDLTTSGSAYDPDVAVGKNGRTQVAWRERFGPSENAIYYRAIQADGSWGAAEMVSTEGGNATTPAIVVDAAGATHLLWYHPDSGDTYYAFKPVGEAWAAPQGLPFRPWLYSTEQFASDSQGRLHLAWSETDGNSGSSQVLSATKPLTMTEWSEPTAAAGGTYPYFSANHVALTIDGQDNVHLAWEGSGRLWYGLRDTDGSWLSPSGVHSSSTGWHGFDESLSLAVDTRGNKHIAWDTGIEGDIWYAGLQGTPPVETLLTPEGGRLKSAGASLSFPAGAVVSDTLVTLAPKTALPPGSLLPVLGYDLAAERLSDGAPLAAFSRPYTLTLEYTEDKLPLIESSLALYWWDGAQWARDLSGSLEIDLNRLTAHPSRVGLFALLSETMRVFAPLLTR